MLTNFIAFFQQKLRILPKYSKGQSLFEILIAIILGVIFIGGSTILIGMSLRGYQSAKAQLQANSLMRQNAEVIIALTKENWHSIYDLTKDTKYKITPVGNTFAISEGEEVSIINGLPYKRYFKVFNVQRESIEPTRFWPGLINESGPVSDPNTQKITIYSEYGTNYQSSASISFYLTRSQNNHGFYQKDWTGGPNQAGPVSMALAPNGFDYAENINYLTGAPHPNLMMATTTIPEAVLISSILDSGIAGGAGFNSFIIDGVWSPADYNVEVQFAFSNSPTGPWVFYGPTSTNDFYNNLHPGEIHGFPLTGAASPQNNRYLRYKLHFITQPGGTSPVVDRIRINWNP